LPESFATLIAQHSEVQERDFSVVPGTQIVAVSSLMPSTCDSEWNERAAFLSALRRLSKIRPLSAQELFETVEADFAEFAPVLKLAQPARPLVDYLQTDSVAL
jgi:hypothetical protein